MDWATFFAMGGYAFEVWTCWGLTLATLLIYVIYYKHKNGKIRASIKRQIGRDHQLNQNQPNG